MYHYNDHVTHLQSEEPQLPELPFSQPPDVTSAVTSSGYYSHGDHGKDKEKKKGRFKIFGSKR